MKKILITGATGFVGSHLTELCVEKGYKVVAFDRYSPNYNLGWLEKSKYKNDINFVFGDIRDYDSVLKTMKDCQIVFHLAALIGIPYSYLSPQAYIKTNVEGTYNILESAKHLDIEQTINQIRKIKKIRYNGQWILIFYNAPGTRIRLLATPKWQNTVEMQG